MNYPYDLLFEVILVAATEWDKRPYYFQEDGLILRGLRGARQPFLYLPRAEVAVLSVTELEIELKDAFRRIC